MSVGRFTRLLVGVSLFVMSAMWYWVIGTDAAWWVLLAGTGFVMMAVLHDERSGR